MAAPMLASTDKVPLGNSPVTGQPYFPMTFNCMKEIHQLTQASAKGNYKADTIDMHTIQCTV